MLSAASFSYRIRFPNNNFLSTQVPPSQFFLTGPLPPLLAPASQALMASQSLPGERSPKNSILVSTHSSFLSSLPPCPSQSLVSISSQLTAFWLIHSPGPYYLLHLYSQWVTQSPPPPPGLPRLFLTLFRRCALSCRRFPVLSATAKALLGHATASAILLKQLVALFLPRPTAWIRIS